MSRASMTRLAGLVFLGLALALVAAPASAVDGVKVKAFRGNWACSFEAAHGFFGETAGVAHLNIARNGDLTGEEIIASAEPHVELDVEMSGRMRSRANGMIRGDITVHVANLPGVPDQEFEIVCVGSDPEGDRYTHMRCLDVFDEPDGTHQVAVLECNSQD
jgi:hypothetical protein